MREKREKDFAARFYLLRFGEGKKNE